jgi:hypothetical protein
VAHLKLVLSRRVKGTWNNVTIVTVASVRTGSGQKYIFPRHFFIHKDEYRVTLEAFANTKHSNVVAKVAKLVV